jgi:hypothetical protein
MHVPELVHSDVEGGGDVVERAVSTAYTALERVDCVLPRRDGGSRVPNIRLHIHTHTP